MIKFYKRYFTKENKNMKNDNINLSIAVDSLNRKIAEINIKIVDGDTSEEVRLKLEEYLNAKEEILRGNTLLVDKVISGEI